MSFPLWDLAQDLAVARGGNRVETDPMERMEGRNLHRRLAALAWIPLAGGVLVLASLANSTIVTIALLAALLVGLWLSPRAGLRSWRG
jgi:hypothetical protein